MTYSLDGAQYLVTGSGNQLVAFTLPSTKVRELATAQIAGSDDQS